MEEIAENHNSRRQLQQQPVDTPPVLPQTNKHGNSGGGGGRKSTSTDEQVKLAAVAISSNIRLRSADMPFAMQERALRQARALVDACRRNRPNPTVLARSLKKEFDSVYGPAWHCVAGSSFGSFVTHSPGGFVYFSVDSLSVLLFKTEVHLITHHSPPPYPAP